MSLQKLLNEKKAAILERWFDVVLGTYPTDTQSFLRKKKNRFANPVAHEISSGLAGVFEQLLDKAGSAEIAPFLDKVIRIRAVQELSPSRALSFIFALKGVIREELPAMANDARLSEELEELDGRIDELGLLSLDLYVGCREKIYELRVKEVKNRVGRLLARADLLQESVEEQQDPEVISPITLT